MSIFICDGENILMDKITTHVHDTSHCHRDFRYKGEEAENTYHERDCKLNGIETPIEVKFWGQEVVLWTFLGWHNSKVNQYLCEGDSSIDFQHLVYSSNSFGTNDILGTETDYVFITKDGFLNRVVWEKETQTYVAFENSLEAMQQPGVVCKVFGCGDKNLDGFQEVALDRPLTAIELLVLAQGMYPGLGRRFDHYHIPTRKLHKDLDLSVRQRKLITDKIQSEIRLSYATTMVLEN